MGPLYGGTASSCFLGSPLCAAAVDGGGWRWLSAVGTVVQRVPAAESSVVQCGSAWSSVVQRG